MQLDFSLHLKLQYVLYKKTYLQLQLTCIETLYYKFIYNI